MNEICKKVAEYYRIPFEKLFSKSRKSKLVEARRMCMLLMYETLRKSHQQIANYFEMDRTTVIYHVDLLKEEIKTGVYKETVKEYNMLKDYGGNWHDNCIT